METNLFSHHLSKCILILNFDFYRFSVLSLKRLDRISLFKPYHTMFMMNTLMSENFVEIDSLQHLEILRPTLPTKNLDHKSALLLSMF